MPRPHGMNMGPMERKLAQLKFIEGLLQTGTITGGVDAAGISFSSWQYWRDNDADFREKFEEATQRLNDAIDAEIRRRGELGWEEPVYQQGVMVGTVRRYSDNLLLARAKSRMPKYRDRMELSGPDGGPIEVTYADQVLTSINALAERLRSAQLTGAVIDAEFEVDPPPSLGSIPAPDEELDVEK